MTKPELIDELAKAAGLTKQESAVIVETVFECITAALVKGHKVELRGFGSFKVRQHRSRTARNPKVGTAVYVPAKKVFDDDDAAANGGLGPLENLVHVAGHAPVYKGNARSIGHEARQNRKLRDRDRMSGRVQEVPEPFTGLEVREKSPLWRCRNTCDFVRHEIPVMA
jgi:nucleoid DNA-binding protein